MTDKKVILQSDKSNEIENNFSKIKEFWKKQDEMNIMKKKNNENNNQKNNIQNKKMIDYTNDIETIIEKYYNDI